MSIHIKICARLHICLCLLRSSRIAVVATEAAAEEQATQTGSGMKEASFICKALLSPLPLSLLFLGYFKNVLFVIVANVGFVRLYLVLKASKCC